MSLCQSCKKRETCIELCSKARLIVEKDFVKPRELNIGQPQYSRHPMPDFVKKYMNTKKLSKRFIFSRFYTLPRNIQILTLINLGFKREHICQMLEISRGNLRWYIWDLKKQI